MKTFTVEIVHEKRGTFRWREAADLTFENGRLLFNYDGQWTFTSIPIAELLSLKIQRNP